ncbi:hypothetical protein BpHYR1_012343, partial [Brachionus plicatilis]
KFKIDIWLENIRAISIKAFYNFNLIYKIYIYSPNWGNEDINSDKKKKKIFQENNFLKINMANN